jgi:hypothetical protein
MKNDVFWDIKTQFIPHRRHITSLQISAGSCYVRFVVFKTVTTKKEVFWDIKSQFLPHRRHITSPLQSSAGFHGGDYEECLILSSDPSH